MKNNIHWCKNCNQAGVPTIACLEDGIINTVSEMRYGSADKKQFNATLEYNLNKALDRQRQQIRQIIKECGHQQEDDTIWCDMDELLKKI